MDCDVNVWRSPQVAETPEGGTRVFRSARGAAAEVVVPFGLSKAGLFSGCPVVPGIGYFIYIIPRTVQEASLEWYFPKSSHIL